MIKLPNWLRPYAGNLIGSAITIGLGQAVVHAPILGNFVTQDMANKLTTVVMGYVFAHGATTAVNATVNPTQSAVPSLASTVPTTVNDKSEGTNNVSK